MVQSITPRFDIEVDDLELINDGFVMSHGLEPIEITIDSELFIKFEFEFNDEEETNIVTNVISDTELTLKLLNHGGGVVVGTTSSMVGPTNPILIGTNQGKELFVTYRMSTEYDDGEPVLVNFYYNFYLGEEIGESELEGQNDES